MAANLVQSGFHVCGFDVFKPTLTKFLEAGGLIGNSPADVAKDCEVLVIMVANEKQAESVLFGEDGAVKALPIGTTVILCSTVRPRFMKELGRRLEGENRDLQLVDAPVSGGVVKAAQGSLTIMASGTTEALTRAGTVLSALSEKLYIIEGGASSGSSVKMINQLLAGVHIAAAAEAMAFGARLGLNTKNLFDIISNSDGNSWMFGNRVPHMLENDYAPYSAVDIFVKDLGIVLQESKELKVPLYISACAHQQFLLGSAAGWGRCDDASVVKIFEKLTGINVEASLPVLPKEETLKSLPCEWGADPSDEIIRVEEEGDAKVLVVLDDDPTGTQTVHGITVLTEWSIQSLIEEFSKRPACFFILTNSRALSSEKAVLLTKEICQNVAEAAARAKNVKYTIVLRGDSTLRGHFPEEADAAASVIGETDAWIICPFFLQGGRFTIDDVHYVADGDKLIPAGKTEFAKDAAFGYKASNLREWVEEKTKGRVSARSVTSISIETIRKGGPDAVCEQLCNLPKGSICVVNAVSERDVSVFAAGMLKAELKGKHFLCRTAASFVSARIGIQAKDPITPKQLGIYGKKSGGLIVVGSYVPKTTKQVKELITKCGHILKSIEVSVEAVALQSENDRVEEISRAVKLADMFLRSKKDTLIITSRELVKGKSASESLEINSKVSLALVEIVKQIQTKPRYLLAKGGITSSDLATKALEARRAEVVGQALSGVPLWQLGPESRHPGLPYIVFPGNVGGENALAEVVINWSLRRSSTRDILLEAEKGGYAVGAFNVYNLEGASAVIAAAEAERSPAILQIHPSALKHGGASLVVSCLSKAEHATVPVTVHFDHGSEEEELLDVLEMGIDSLMVDGSHLPLNENISFTKHIATLAHAQNKVVEAELGRLSGTEDNLTVEEYEAKFTDVNQAEEFLNQTGVDALAVCIGNVHGKYPANGPRLRLDILKELYAIASRKGVALVLHGASGLHSDLVKACIDLGVRKFNVNTEVRSAYIKALQTPRKDLLDIMSFAEKSMQTVVAEKMCLFGSAGKAC
eukprot:TRINITY_DN5892_c0_g1_i1.p1 TRINITY_DN5892_c0_g1~~TRINITY_DN5892_c0_g1_i1.p1  ORF type:complete len:1072 (-),score=299.13 TRINITY_DN5892_c0_g1_i1:548-3667(-)